MAARTSKVKKSLIEKLVDSGLTVATKVNDIAIKTTEKAFIKSFETSEKCISMSSKVVKRGLQISASQQDLVFDVLEGAKKKIIKK